MEWHRWGILENKCRRHTKRRVGNLGIKPEVQNGTTCKLNQGEQANAAFYTNSYSLGNKQVDILTGAGTNEATIIEATQRRLPEAELISPDVSNRFHIHRQDLGINMPRRDCPTNKRGRGTENQWQAYAPLL